MAEKANYPEPVKVPIPSPAHFECPTDPTGRLGHTEARQLASAQLADGAYNEYLTKTDPEMAAWNARIAADDAANRMAFMIALHDKREAGLAEVENRLRGVRDYVAEKVTSTGEVESLAEAV